MSFPRTSIARPRPLLGTSQLIPLRRGHQTPSRVPASRSVAASRRRRHSRRRRQEERTFFVASRRHCLVSLERVVSTAIEDRGQWEMRKRGANERERTHVPRTAAEIELSNDGLAPRIRRTAVAMTAHESSGGHRCVARRELNRFKQ